MTSPHLIIFDCDGVLVDSEMIASRQLAAYLTELGRPTQPEECRRTFTGMSIKSVGEHVESAWGLNLPGNFVEQLRLRDRDAFAQELKPVPGIARVLERLTEAGVPICVASSGTPEKIHHSLELTGLTGFFGEHLFSAAQVARGKPAPDLFAFAAQRMRTAPEHAVVIEDAAPGVQGARAAGMTVFGFTGGSHCTAESPEHLIAAGAHQTFAHMDDFPQTLF